MDGKISRHTRRELVQAMRKRYHQASKKAKGTILDELVGLMNCHRKHAIRLMSQRTSEASPRTGKRVYDEAVRETLIVLWEAADRICGKRLKALIPSLLESMESHGHLQLDSEVRSRVLAVSASTIDRLLSDIRSQATARKKRRSTTKPSKHVPIRTFADWEEPQPGFLEIDLVVHCGGSMKGSYIHSLVATDVNSGWTESVPLLVREQSLVVEGLDLIRRQLPVPVLGIDSDNDSAFINDTLVAYTQREQIEFTRSRAYRKNDQAWIEQKNGAVIRRFAGYERFSGVVAGQALSQLYQATRLYVNFFQPSFKLLKKTRVGSKVRKTYLPPATPCDRLLMHDAVSTANKESLRKQRSQLDPLELLHRIRNTQSALAKLSTPGRSEGEAADLAQFLAQLPRLWQSGEPRATHRKNCDEVRSWRTRKDPFEKVWSEVLVWLQKEPDATAKSLFQRLQREYPEEFPNGQLRTLQRRIREWRQVMARELVFSEGNSSQASTPVPQPVSLAQENSEHRLRRKTKTTAENHKKPALDTSGREQS